MLTTELCRGSAFGHGSHHEVGSATGDQHPQKGPKDASVRAHSGWHSAHEFSCYNFRATIPNFLALPKELFQVDAFKLRAGHKC